ncbi:PRD domain-containing protein [Vagococcus sp. BWB3-3]|uniref:PRD domain-containing protein n=1 Tax=Vagococcus allomyrinae TaxID=2794353 RepID=A0A940SR92_9ENTE|nr:PRD domain-containing protein [Vagococcus allomyrinae]MBP1040542.1 PRD domain-containing protein [Vagococcus allomyrinae]
MSLANKWYQILNILLLKRCISLAELSRLTGTSTQTLKKNIDLLNEQLAGTAIINLENKGAELIIHRLIDFQEIMTGKLKQDRDFNSSGKRMAYILRALLAQADFLLIDDLAEALLVSRGTVNKDIKLIKAQLLDYGVSLQGIPNKGLQIVGAEYKLRLIILNAVFDYYSDDYQLKQETLLVIDKLAKHYKLDQSTVVLLKKVVAVTIGRILAKKPMRQGIAYYKNFESQAPLIEEFIVHLERVYQLTLGQYDQDFISFPINTRTTAMVSDDMGQFEQGVRLIFDDMMEEVGNNFVTEFDSEELFDLMKYHLMFMLNRVIFHIELVDLFMDEIQMKYPFSYEVAKVAISVIETKLLLPINEIEISYLTIYFELVLNKKKGDVKHRQVAIVCSSGRGTATLIKRQLAEVLGPDIELVQYSELEYQDIDLANYLAVFSTLPLPAKAGKPIIQITNLFDNQLLLQEWKRVDEPNILTSPLLDFSFSVLDDQLSYLENVKEMVTGLIANQKLSASFLSLWEEREKRQTTIFDQGIGFPHTINQGASKIVLSIGVFREPKQEEHQYVQLVFLVGIPEIIADPIEQVLMDVYDFIFSIGGNEHSIAEVSQFSDREQMIAFVSNLKK